VSVGAIVVEVVVYNCGCERVLILEGRCEVQKLKIDDMCQESSDILKLHIFQLHINKKWVVFFKIFPTTRTSIYKCFSLFVGRLLKLTIPVTRISWYKHTRRRTTSIKNDCA